MRKRDFIKRAGILGMGAIMSNKIFIEMIDKYADVPAGELARNEDFWLEVRKGYRLNPDIINLENGYYNIIPEQTLERFIRHVRDVNYQGSYYMRTVQFDNKKAMAAKLAAIAGCQADELIITRNTTESLDIIISGYPWKEGDEAVMAEQDYPTMLTMFKQVAKRYGVVNKVVSVPHDPGSDDEIVNLYANAITGKTKLLMICHMINITGHILPVRKICDMAHSRGVEVMVDGAHTFGHIRFTIPELGCDYFGSSLHKWMSVPLGAGLLWVKREHISKIWPLMAPVEDNPDDISRLNHTGTHPVHTDLTVEDAIEFYLMLGPERKEARLRYLQHYWSDRVRVLPHIEMYTPSDPARSCGIATVGVRGMKPAELADILFKKYRIYTAPIDGAGVHGCRITPNVFTTTEELDVLVKALKEIK
ncbi:MAG TPA: aminotransferase class V-fold PLP-dependent enzyme [Bacteroidales bacterium]|nr:aminotransferase class V-fold PLP-dependent enzyme [Bacteroidales bacterium]